MSFRPYWLAYHNAMPLIAARSYKYQFFKKSLVINHAFIYILSIMHKYEKILQCEEDSDQEAVWYGFGGFS